MSIVKSATIDHKESICYPLLLTENTQYFYNFSFIFNTGSLEFSPLILKGTHWCRFIMYRPKSAQTTNEVTMHIILVASSRAHVDPSGTAAFIADLTTTYEALLSVIIQSMHLLRNEADKPLI